MAEKRVVNQSHPPTEINARAVSDVRGVLVSALRGTLGRFHFFPMARVESLYG